MKHNATLKKSSSLSLPKIMPSKAYKAQNIEII